MKRYHLMLGLLIAGLFITVSLPAKVSAESILVEMEAGDPPTTQECLILKVAADAVQISYSDLLSGFERGTVDIVALPNDHYCVAYGSGANDFIIIDLEED